MPRRQPTGPDQGRSILVGVDEDQRERMRQARGTARLVGCGVLVLVVGFVGMMLVFAALVMAALARYLGLL